MNRHDRQRWASHVIRTKITPTSFYREEGEHGTVVINVQKGGVGIQTINTIYNNCKIFGCAKHDAPRQSTGNKEDSSGSTGGARISTSPGTSKTLEDIRSSILDNAEGGANNALQFGDNSPTGTSVLSSNCEKQDAGISEGEVTEEDK